MKKIISSFLIVSMMASSIPAFAADPVKPSTPVTVDSMPAPVVSPLNKGQSAPYSGVLLSTSAVAQIIAEKDMADAAIKLAVQHQLDLDAANLKYQIDQQTTTCTTDKNILQAQVDDGKKQIAILNDQLKKNTGGPGAPVWIGLGAVGGVVVTVLTVFAISKASK